MASVYGIVRSIAKAGSPGPMLRSIVSSRKPVADPVPSRPPAFVALVESEIIPRLMVAHGLDCEERRDGEDHGVDTGCADPRCADASDAQTPSCAPGRDATISYYEANAFAPLAINLGACELLDHIDVFLARGVPVDTIFVELLAPAARHLGELWDEDTADFITVTMALWRLQEVVRELSARVPVRGMTGDYAARTALFAVMPGDQHSFGTVIVEDVFRRNGWATDLMTETTTSSLLAMVARNNYDLVGLTVSGDHAADDAPSLINAVRSVSRNPFVGIMVGGRLFTDDPHLAVKIGADSTAPDAVQALEVARTLVDGLLARSDLCV